MLERCKKHNPRHPDDFNAWIDWVRLQDARGHKPRQCPVCHHFFYRCEFGGGWDKAISKKEWENLTMRRSERL